MKEYQQENSFVGQQNLITVKSRLKSRYIDGKLYLNFLYK